MDFYINGQPATEEEFAAVCRGQLGAGGGGGGGLHITSRYIARLRGGPYDGVIVSSPRPLGRQITITEDGSGGGVEWSVASTTYRRDDESGDYRPSPVGGGGRQQTPGVPARFGTVAWAPAGTGGAGGPSADGLIGSGHVGPPDVSPEWGQLGGAGGGTPGAPGQPGQSIGGGRGGAGGQGDAGW